MRDTESHDDTTERPRQDTAGSDERVLILRMLQDGKLTPEEAATLLDAVGRSHGQPPTGPSPATGAAFLEEIRRGVDAALRRLPRESFASDLLDDIGDVVRESIREASRGSRAAARAWRQWDPEGWGKKLATALAGGPEAAAPFEDVRATDAKRLTIRNTRGDVRLARSSDGRLRVRAQRRVRAPDPQTAERLAERLPINIDDQGDVILVEGPAARPYHERIRVDFDVAVPDGMRVEVALVRGDVTTDLPASEISISMVKGDVRIADCARATVHVTSGDVAVYRARGDVTVNTTRGRVAVDDALGEVIISTRRGDVDARVELARRLQINALRGDVTVRIHRFAPDAAPPASAVIDTLRGDVVLYLGPEVRCRLEASAVSGDLNSRLPLRDSHWDRGRLTGVLIAPEATVRIGTTRGDVALLPLEDAPADARASVS